MNNEAEGESPNRFLICKLCSIEIDTLTELYYEPKPQAELKALAGVSVQNPKFFHQRCAEVYQQEKKIEMLVVKSPVSQRINAEKEIEKNLSEIGIIFSRYHNLNYEQSPIGTVFCCPLCGRTQRWRSRLEFLCNNKEHHAFYFIAYSYSIKYDSNNRIIEATQYNPKDN